MEENEYEEYKENYFKNSNIFCADFRCFVLSGYLYWMIRSSLMNTVEVFMMPPRWIPSKFMWENYQEVLIHFPLENIS